MPTLIVGLLVAALGGASVQIGRLQRVQRRMRWVQLRLPCRNASGKDRTGLQPLQRKIKWADGRIFHAAVCFCVCGAVTAACCAA